jgi:cytochrome c oxidase subunit IV/membrane-associated phospholipid phosphatase
MTTTDDPSPAGEVEEEGIPSRDEMVVGAVNGDDYGDSKKVGRGLSASWSDGGRRRVLLGWSALIASLVVYFFLAGVPWSLNWVFLYIAAGLIVSSLGSGVKWKRLVKDWLPFFLVLTAYGLLRSYASHTLWGPFYRPQIWFDTHVAGLGVDPTVQLQRWLYTPRLHFWDYLCWCCYMSHFFASFIIAAVLWKTNHARFRRFVPLFIGLTVLGYVTYVLYPAMPPWMASEYHHLPPTTRIIPVVLDHLHLHSGAAVFTGGDKFDNNVAAMPSIHAAYPMLICLFFWKGASARKRIVLAAYPICMAFTLVYTGEHFVIDILMGWLYAVATFYFGSKLLDRWESRRKGRQTFTQPISGSKVLENA